MKNKKIFIIIVTKKHKSIQQYINAAHINFNTFIFLNQRKIDLKYFRC